MHYLHSIAMDAIPNVYRASGWLYLTWLNVEHDSKSMCCVLGSSEEHMQISSVVYQTC